MNENVCHACNGTTVLACRQCGGSRIEYDDPHERCWACRGSGFEQCDRCKQEPTMAKKAAKVRSCECLNQVNEKLREESGCELETNMSLNLQTREVRADGPLLKVRRWDGSSSRKKLPTVICTYCPFCGKKKS